MDSASDGSPYELIARSLWSDAFRRFRRNKGAVVGLGIVIIMSLAAIAAPWITGYNPILQDLSNTLSPPSPEHFFGTDDFGRDLFTRVVYGARISLWVGLVATGIGCLIGIPLGLASGYQAGWVDNVIMWLVDLMLAFPGLLLALAIMAILGPSLTNAMIAVGIGIAPSYIRLTRASVMSVKEMGYVTAARAIGASHLRIISRHVFPNVLLPLVIITTLDVAGAILFTSGLSFLGLGAQAPTPEWGTILSSGRRFMRQAWWISVFPGLAISSVVLAMNLIGDGLRDALDPRLTLRK